MKGSELVEQCKTHLIDTMRHLEDCQPGAPGLGNRAIEVEAGFELDLPGYDSYFTWSLLKSLVNEGRIEQIEGSRGARYRLLP